VGKEPLKKVKVMWKKSGENFGKIALTILIA
jgi:hypothetical protein